ncbi:WXG100 family type VII secretion target [Nocardia sp. NPDC051570]|uniref:WXG100 family type VII secretion target n=1 Tax=Nocardia sp. NPDC051570 TaxID=3364324 RepID=UPI00378F0516
MHEINGGPRRSTDPDYSPNCEVFDHLGYDEIYRGVAQLKPEVLTAGRETWRSSATGVAEAVQQAHAEIRAAIADGWRGPAAELAAGAVQSFEELGRQLSDVMTEVGQRLGQANDAAETLRAALSHPVANQLDLEAALLDPRRATANVAVQKAAEDLRLDAVRVMNSVYAETFLPTGTNVPAFQDDGMYPSPAVVEGPADPTAPGGGSADVMAPGAVPVPGSQPETVHPTETVRPTATVSNESAAEAPPENIRAGNGGSVTSTAPAAVTVAPTAPAAVPAVEHAIVPPAAAPAVNGIVPQPVSSVEPSSTSAASAAPAVAAPTTRIASTDSENQRKRTDRDDRRDASSDTIGGMGAGVVGGLAGGAFAAGGDALRPSSAMPVPPKPARLEDEEDEDYYSDLDEPTFLEPADPGGALVGRMDPTTPPVLGEWAEE